VLIPDLGQHSTAVACQSTPPLDSRRRTSPITALNGLFFRHQPDRIKA
jgi:hypothetical protein